MIAGALDEQTRTADAVARLGGDEFALLLPETDAEAARVLVERIRALVSERCAEAGTPVTVSGGVCELGSAGDRAELLRLADGALYWSKAHGRDFVCVYDPALVPEVSASERVGQLARLQALGGLRALARAIDAKDPMTQRHSERVAELAERLALASGWPPARAARLREAALVHDVGKIGVPDALLLKPARLTAAEYERSGATPRSGPRSSPTCSTPSR